MGESQYNFDGPVPVPSLVVSKARWGAGSNVRYWKCPIAGGGKKRALRSLPILSNHKSLLVVSAVMEC